MADEASDLRGLPAGTTHWSLEEVVSYRSGDLPSERSQHFEQHLVGCPACRRLVRDAAAVLTDVDLIVRAAESRVSQVDLILARLRRTAAERATRPLTREPRQPSHRFWLPVMGVAAVVVLVALLQLLMAMLPRLWGEARRGLGSAPSGTGSPARASVGPPTP